MIELWFLAVAVIFTVFGYIIGVKKQVKVSAEMIISTTIDTLIEDGYLKTRGTGNNLEILKVDDKADRTQP
jgi:hypothetical protein